MKQAREFRLVECSGSAYEIGGQWGEGCKESFYKVSENIDAMMGLMHQVTKDRAVSAAMKFLPVVQEFDPYLVDIMRGQADATGLPFEEIFAQKCFNEIFFNYHQISGLCTSFAATGRATRDGAAIIGQNIDFLAEAPIDLLKIRHESGLEQFILCFSNASEFTFSSAGIGMCGNVTIGTQYAFNVPVACYLPRVMRQTSIHDARELLEKVARGLGYFHLADANGQMFGIESVAGDFQLMKPEKEVLLHSNHYITQRFKEQDTAPELQPDSYHRLETIQSLVNQCYGQLDVEGFMEILTNHEHHPYSICRHNDPAAPISSVTLASFIEVPAEGAIYICAGNPCEHEYQRYTF